MIAYHIELFVFFLFAATIILLWRFGRTPVKKAFLTALGIGAILSVILEIMNERWFAGQGTLYPIVLLRLYPFEFPVAIVLFTGMYAATVAFLSFALAAQIVSPPSSLHLFTAFLLAALLNLVSLGIEQGGIALGWWYHQRATDLSRIYPHVYLFYAAAVFPATIAFAIFRHRGTKR